MRYIVCVVMTLVIFTTNTFANYTLIPTKVDRQTINGVRYITKTYTTTTDIDPMSLIEEDFESGGYLFTNETFERIEHEELVKKVVTLDAKAESESNQLEDLIRLFSGTKPYDQDGFTGELRLNVNSIYTEVAGYKTSSYTVSDTREYLGLMYPDPSYVAQSINKDGTTLPLVDIRFDVTATGLAGDSLVPTEYKAIGTYSQSFSKQVPTGYVARAIYEGEVTKTEVKEATYIITYVGAEIKSEEVELIEETKEIEEVELIEEILEETVDVDDIYHR